MKESKRQKIKRIIASIMTWIVVFTQYPIDGSQRSNAEPEVNIPIVDIEIYLSQEALEMQYGTPAELQVSANCIYWWVSANNPSVNEVSTDISIDELTYEFDKKGIVSYTLDPDTGVIKLEPTGIGTTKLTVSYSDSRAECQISVNSAVSNLRIDEPDKSILCFQEGKEIGFSASYDGIIAENEKFRWKSDNIDVIGFGENDDEAVGTDVTGIMRSSGSANMTVELIYMDDSLEIEEGIVSANTIQLVKTIVPDIKIKDGDGNNEKIYDGSEYISNDKFDITWPEDVIEEEICRGICFKADSADVGERKVTVSFDCDPNSELSFLEIELEESFYITKRVISMNGVTISGSREYEKGNVDIPDDAITYSFEGVIEADKDEVKGGGIAYKLENDNVGDNKTIIIPELNGDNELLKLTGAKAGNYECHYDPSVSVNSYFSITPGTITISSNGISKQSDGTTTVSLNSSSEIYLVGSDGETIDDISISVNSTASWNYEDPKPGTDKKITGAEPADFYISESVNYVFEINLKGDITFKPVDQKIDLRTGETTLELEAGVNVRFNKAKNLSGEDIKWYSGDKGGNESSRFGFDDPTALFVEIVDDELKEINNIVLTEGNNNKESVYIKKNFYDGRNIYYGPVEITYAYDNTLPEADIYSICDDAITIVVEPEDAHSGIHAVYAHVFPLGERPDHPEVEQIKDEGPLDITEDSTYTISFDGIVGNVCVLVEDNAGNYYIQWANTTDFEAPVLTVDDSSGFEKENKYNADNNLKSLSINCIVTDRSADADDPAGLKEIAYYLLDGKTGDVSDWELYKIEGSTRFIIKSWDQNEAPNSETVSINLSGDTCPGYKLRVIVEAVDYNHNKSFNVIYYNGESISKNDTVYTNKAVSENELNYCKKIEDVCEKLEPDTPAFAIDGTMTMITIKDGREESSNEYDGVYYFDVKGTDIGGGIPGRKLSVSFDQLGFQYITLKDSVSSQHTGTLSGNYSVKKHCYSVSNMKLVYPEQTGSEEAYTISFSVPGAIDTGVNELPFGGYDFPKQNKRFIVDGTVPSVSVNLPEEDGSRENTAFYDKPVTATIIIKDAHLPDADDVGTYYDIFYKSGSKEKDGLKDKVVWNKENDTLTGSLLFAQDDEFAEFMVEATDLTRRDMVHESSGKEFIIDTIPPVFTISYNEASNVVAVSGNGVSGNNVFKHYYGLQGGDGDPTDVIVTISIKERNFISEEVYVTVSNNTERKTYDYGNLDWEPLSSDVNDPACDTKTVVFSIPGIKGGENDGEYQVEVSYEDPVHHKMITSDAQEVTFRVEDGKYDGSEHINVIDTLRPEAEFSITPLLDVKYSFPDEADYYNIPFTGTFKVDETNFSNDAEYIHSEILKYDGVAFSKHGDLQLSNDGSGTSLYAYVVSADRVNEVSNEGEYKYVISGKDLAKNKLLVKMGSGCTDNDVEKYNEEQKEEYGKEHKDRYDEYYTSGTKVYDITAPVVSLNFALESGNKKNDRVEYANTKNGTSRYYFNENFTATFAISEEHYCASDNFVKVKYGQRNNATNYAEDKVTKEYFQVFQGPSTSNNGLYGYSRFFDKEGLYCFTIEGEDKAGNDFVINEDLKTPNLQNNFESAEKSLSNNRTLYTSYIVAIDKTHPQLVNIEIGDFYKAALWSDDGKVHYQVSQNQPYQSIDSTTVKFIRSDKSPANIVFTISSTIGDVNGGSSKVYTYGFGEDNGYVCKVPMNGQQVFYIDSITMEDYAGNSLEWSGDSNKIYLDVTPPNHDELAPTVQAAAIADGSGRGPQGNPLFASDVDVRITVEDPNEVVSSSGLYQIFYRVMVNGEDMTGVTTPSTTTGAAGGGIVSFLSSGPTYSENSDTTDEELTYRSELNFHFDKNTYNCNDIKIYVWGGDDAGNEIPESNAAFYAFGIDSTNPTITVTYDNNDVRNEKYFKADRTATVTVMERNFDPSRTIITTEAGARIGGWEYIRGNSANGDDDKWISHVRYDHDGNYTFNVTAIDLVGNEAPPANYGESVAPKAFVIDKTVPVINVTFDNNDVHNGKYYNKKRIADVEITEHNFNAADVRILNPVSLDGSRIGSPRISAWEGTGDKKSASLTHSADGDYTLRIEYTDLAGNVAESYVADEFTIDTTAPELLITGVEDMHAYNDKVAPVIEYSDLNLDGDSAKVEISGMLHKENNSLEGVKTQDENGGSLVCSDIEHIKANDDVYKAVGVIKDLAGNETKKEITFSVNRFGSNYIVSDDTQQLIDKVYTNKEQSIHVTEINVSDLGMHEIEKAVNGNIDKLTEGTDYTLEVSKPGWVQYDYDISAENFAEEGSYVVTLYSEDKASNKNSNRSVHDENGVNEMPIEFVVDKTAPSIIISGVEQNGRYYDRERIIKLHYEDNNLATRLEVTDASGKVTVYYLEAYYDGSEDSRDIRKVAPASEYIAIMPNAEGDIELRIQALNHKQSISIKAVDAAGNEAEFSSPKFLLTTNLFVQFVNNTAAIVFAIVVLALLGAIVFVIIQRRRKKENI